MTMNTVDGELEPEVATKTRKTPIALTPEQKQAATLRRDASILRKHGSAAEADKLQAQADQLAPERSQGAKRLDPLTVLNQEEQKWLQNYFMTTTKGFAKIAQHISAKKLEDIFQAQGN